MWILGNVDFNWVPVVFYRLIVHFVWHGTPVIVPFEDLIRPEFSERAKQLVSVLPKPILNGIWRYTRQGGMVNETLAQNEVQPDGENVGKTKKTVSPMFVSEVLTSRF